MRWLNFFPISIALTCFASTAVNAQRDAPVWSCYLSPISISNEHPILSAKFVLHKNGGPHEHFEHQCYMLLYLKTDEEKILNSIKDAAFVDKKNQAGQPFLVDLEKKGLVAKLKSKVSKRVSDENRKDQECTAGFCFPFEFDFDISDLFKTLQSDTKFDATDVKISGKSRWFNQEFGLIVFVPVNDSIYSNDVAAELKQTHDFANIMNWDTSILYFKPLPYGFSFKQHETKLILCIN